MLPGLTLKIKRQPTFMLSSIVSFLNKILLHIAKPQPALHKMKYFCLGGFQNECCCCGMWELKAEAEREENRPFNCV